MKKIIFQFLFFLVYFSLSAQYYDGDSILNFKCGDTLIDIRNGGKYPTVKIGKQCWFAKNLNIGNMLNVSSTNLNQTDNGIIEKYCYNNDTGNCTLYGGLYQWNEMMNYLTSEAVQGICPDDWHVPSDSDYLKLSANYPDSIAGKELKVGGTSGFRALASGYCYYSGSKWIFGSLGVYGNIRTSTQASSPPGVAWVRYYYPSDNKFYRSTYPKTSGYSVRCIYSGSSVSINNQKSESFNIKAFPNPTFNRITFEYKLPMMTKDASILIFDVNGKLIKTIGLSKNEQLVNIPLESLSAGTYFYSLKIDGHKYNSRKFTVIK